MGCGSSSRCRQPAALSKTQRAMKSAVLIQRWYRRHVARLEARRQCTWRIFQSIEYAAEQDQLKLHNFFSSLIEQHTLREPGESGAGGEGDEVPRWLRCPPGGSCEEESALCDAIQVPGDYTGPRLDFPLAPGQAVALVNAFKKKQVLHARFALRLLLEARSLLHHLPTVRHASTANRRDITVCGDLHGQLDDLFLIFYKNGLPGVDRPYIFNGDFVDRGSRSLEVLLVLLAFLLAHPHDVFLNRGNHEDYVMNMRYGFTKEILMKYKVHGRLMVRVVRDLFSWLPLATVVDGKALVVHGGLSAATDLELLARIDRHRFVSALRPPKRRTTRGLDSPPADSSSSTSSPAHRQRSAYSSVSDDVALDGEWKQVVDVLWSDPVPQDGCTPNSYRGGGCYFGPDVTRDVLHRHGLQLLVRSHECKQEGYERTHGGQVITIFSASNYYEVGSNRGAYMRLGPELTPSFVQYQVGKATRKLTLRQRVSAVEQSAIAALQEKLLAHRSQLMAAFERADPGHTGLVSVSEWALLVEQELQLGLPWRSLHQQLVGATDGGAPAAPDGSVAYAGCFPERRAGQTQLHSSMQPGLIETIYRHRNSLESIFHAIDQDHSGFISFEEFRQAWRLLSSHVQEGVSDDDVLGLARSIDFNQDGSIDFNEFLEAFRLADKPQ